MQIQLWQTTGAGSHATPALVAAAGKPTKRELGALLKQGRELYAMHLQLVGMHHKMHPGGPLI